MRYVPQKVGKADEFRAEQGNRTLTVGASAEQRVMEAIRSHFRQYGASPSWTELHLATAVPRVSMGRVLQRLVTRRLIALRPGPRGIVLLDRVAMLSDAELEIAAKARGAHVSWIAPALALAYPLGADANCNLPVDDLLCQIDTAEAEGRRHGEATEEGTEAGHAGEAAPAP